VKENDNVNAAAPGSPQFRPDVRAVQGPGGKKHDQFVRFLQRTKNDLFKVIADIDVRFVGEMVLRRTV
jgi:hypothetical protein